MPDDGRIGTDEWAAREWARRQALEAAGGPLGRLRRAWRDTDTRIKLLLGLVLAGALPLLVQDGYVLRVAGLTGLYVILALGLNVVAGLAGLLDLGYVAFYGVGAYLYALLASPQFGQHGPFWLLLPLVVLVGALAGLVLGAPSLRLRGDYLAIVTLGFGQIASLLFVNLDRLEVPFLGLDEPLNITGGPNGIINVDDISLAGLHLQTPVHYYWLILVFVAIVFLAVYHLDRSRIGRAWRAIREDELAAQTMGVNTRKLKLLAFSVGAAIAAGAGLLFAAWQGSVFPPNFDFSLLIMLYAMVVLGGVGSVPGAVIGAVILSVLPELLRSPEVARLIFWGALVFIVLRLFKGRWWRGLGLLGAVVGLGALLKMALYAWAPGWFQQPALAPSVARSPLAPFVGAINAWMIFPRRAGAVGNVAFVLTMFLLLAISRLKGMGRYLLLVPALYGLAFTWEVRLVEDPSVTRMLILGALLVLMMSHRPQGLLGEQWVQKM
jgi:branched-chain amino acid transport system permease protein